MGVLHDLRLGPLRAVFTDATGPSGAVGLEEGNLSYRVAASPRIVSENRARLSASLGIATEWFEARQVHGSRVVDVDACPPSGVFSESSGSSSPPRDGDLPEADALLTARPNRPLAIFTADCVPLVLGAFEPPTLAVVHAGWRGLLAGVVEAAAMAMRRRAGRLDLAVAGPAIGPCCYSVDEERARAFAARFGQSAVRRDAGTLDLHGAVRAALASSGASPLVVQALGPCTACSERLFSFRRDGDRAGRQAVVAWIESEAHK